MSGKKTIPSVATTVPFDRFWAWLQKHPGCVVRAGTPETVLFDDDEFHWTFAVEDEDTYLVQLVLGKRTIGEIAFSRRDVAYVQVEPAEEDDFLFELMSESSESRLAVVHFIMDHPFEDHEQAEGPKAPGGGKRWTH